MNPITVALQGAKGRMGQEIMAALCRDPQLKAVGAVEKGVRDNTLALPDGSGDVPFSSDINSLLAQCRPQVLVDFSAAEATMAAARAASRHKVSLVIGTTGLNAQNLKELEELCKAAGTATVVTPNFALGAVVMIHLARIASKFFDYAEITEMHHHLKADAPSGTALTTAKAMAEARGKPFLYPQTTKETLSGTRGGQVDGIALHSLRQPGLMAHQEVLFGAPGQTLRIRHDTISRECYVPGVILAIKEVVKRRGLVYGLDTLLGL